MEAKIAALEAQIRNLTLGGRWKDLSLAAGIREWSGENNAKPVSDFLAQVDQCARVSNWSEEDKVNIIKAKLTGGALRFVNGRDDLSAEVQYGHLRAALIERFTDKLPARYYHTLLHEATQGKDESPAQFLDRCRVLSSKSTRRGATQVEDRILRDEAEFRLLTSFIHGVRGDVGKELRYKNPSSIEEALNIATVVYHAARLDERQREKHVFLASSGKPERTDTRRSTARWSGQKSHTHREIRPRRPEPRAEGGVRNPVICYVCRQPGHIAK
jgi:hypothetical protein